jgi:hypothetical protein
MAKPQRCYESRYPYEEHTLMLAHINREVLFAPQEAYVLEPRSQGPSKEHLVRKRCHCCRKGGSSSHSLPMRLRDLAISCWLSEEHFGNQSLVDARRRSQDHFWRSEKLRPQLPCGHSASKPARPEAGEISRPIIFCVSFVVSRSPEGRKEIPESRYYV